MYPYPPQGSHDDDHTVLDVRGVRPGQRPPVDVAMLDEPTSEVPVIRPGGAGDDRDRDEPSARAEPADPDQDPDGLTDPEPTMVLTTGGRPPATGGLTEDDPDHDDTNHHDTNHQDPADHDPPTTTPPTGTLPTTSPISPATATATHPIRTTLPGRTQCRHHPTPPTSSLRGRRHRRARRR